MIKKIPTFFKTHKKIILLISALIVVLATITGALAALVATDSKTNTFTLGNIKIEVVEPNWVPDVDTNGDGELDGVGNIVPLSVIDKDPAIKNTGTNDAYVYMQVWIPTVDGAVVDKIVYNDYEVFETLKTSTGDSGTWSIIDSYTSKDENQGYNYYLYAYSVPIAPDETTGTVFDQVKVKDFSAGLENLPIEYSNIVVKGFAIQAKMNNETIETAEEAWELFVKQKGYKQPDNPASNKWSVYSYNETLCKATVYQSSTEEITLPSYPITTQIPEGSVFLGWRDQKGNLHNPGTTLSIDSLFITDPNKEDMVTNINPTFIEVFSSHVLSNNLNSGLPVKLVPINTGSTAVIEREAEFPDEIGTIESYNDGHTVTTDVYGYTTPAASYENWYVYGLKENLTISELFTDYITVQGDGYAKVSASAGNKVGTGSVIEVYDRKGTDTTTDDIMIERFYIIIFGDINGNAQIEYNDWAIANEEVLGMTGWSNEINIEYRTYMVKAANTRRDMFIDIADSENIRLSVIGEAKINQIDASMESIQN